MAQPRVVQRCHAGSTGAVLVLGDDEGAASLQPLEPELNVLGKPALTDVLTVLVVREIEAAAQATAVVAEVVALDSGALTHRR